MTVTQKNEVKFDSIFDFKTKLPGVCSKELGALAHVGCTRYVDFPSSS